MPVDVSMYGAPPQPNFVGTLGAAATIQNQLNQNRLFPLVQQQQQNQIALQKLGITQQQLSNATQGFQVWSQALDPLLKKPNLDDTDVIAAAGDLAQSGAFPVSTIMGKLNDPNDPYPSDQYLAKNPPPPPQPGQPPVNPKYQWVVRHAIQGHSDQQRLQDILGQAGYVNNGQTISGNALSQFGGANYQPGVTNFGPVANVLPPAGAGVKNPTTLATQTLGTLAPQAQSPLPLGTSTVGQPQATATAPQALTAPTGVVSATGVIPAPQPQAATPVGSAAPQTPPQAGGMPGGVMLEPPPGTNESVNAWQGLQGDVQNYSKRMNMLNNIKGDLAGAQTGRGTSYANEIKEFAKAQAPGLLNLIGISPDSIGDYDSANKWMAQYNAAMAGSRGGTTDYQQANTAAGNASTHIDPDAAKAMVNNAIGLERMGVAKAKTYMAQNPGNPGANYLNWSTQNWEPNADVRGYTADLGDVQKNKAAMAALKKSSPLEYANIVKSFVNGNNAGVVNADALK